MMVNILMAQPSGFVIKDSIMQKGLFIPVGTKVIWQIYTTIRRMLSPFPSSPHLKAN